MIELVSAARCTECDICVRVCPMDVFDAVPHAAPVIARQEDCQTCFMCEAYCPSDALFVSPLSGPAPVGSEHLDEDALARSGRLGAYRASIGWGPHREPGSRRDQNYVFTSRLAGLSAPPEPDRKR